MTSAPRGIAIALALATACHSGTRAKDPDLLIGAAQSVVHRTHRPVVDSAHAPLHSSVIASVPEKSVGPFLARQRGVAMAAYLGPGEAGTRRLVSLPMAGDGTPGDSRVAAKTTADSTTLILRAAGGGHGAFVAAWTELTERGEALSVVGLGADGVALAPPVELARTSDDIVWIEIVPTPQGAMCVWAEETRANDANILAVPLDPSGKPRGVPSRVAKGVSAWQIVPTVAGAGIALVSPAPPPKPAGSTVTNPSETSLEWLKLDSEARPVGSPVPVATSIAKIADVDVASVADSIVLAWTDRSLADPDVRMAVIDGNGKVEPPYALSARHGGAKLVAMRGGSSVGIVAWEETGRRPRPLRRLHLARIGADGAVDAKASATVEVDEAAVPELAELDDGFALLTRARTCAEPLGPGDAACSDTSTVPVFVRFDLAFHVVETEPVRIDEGEEMASLAWGLACESEQCLVLAAGSEPQARVRAVQLTERPNHWRAPVPAPPPAEAPTVLAVDTLASGDLYTDVAVTPTEDGALVAAITSSVDESVPTGSPRGATITLRPLDPSGAVRGPSVVLTKRALSGGGVSIAGGTKGNGAAVAWVAREGGRVQVHLSNVDRLGRRLKEVQLTASNGDTSDVAIAWAGGGWIVSWVDTRDGNGEVYATKVDAELSRVAREERITNAPGDASDVVLLGHGSGGGDVWLAWSDPRESPHDGFADIFVTKLSAASARPSIPESRILATAAHSRSPALAPGGAEGGPAIAWIEEAPMGGDAESSSAYGAMIGALDATGHLTGDVTRTRGAGDGFPTSVAIERGPDALRVVLTRAARDDLFLDAMEIAKDRKPTAYPLFTLDGPPSLDVSLSIQGGGVFFNDDGVEVTDGCARRLSIGWSR